MKTTNFCMDLMVPSQLNKDIVFNEALLKIDSFMNFSVIDFIDHKPEQLKNGEKFIISSGEDKNKICYKPLNSKVVLLQEPKAGIVVFIIKTGCFYVFADNDWKNISLPSTKSEESVVPSKFIGISEKFSISPKQSYHYLYLNSDTAIGIEEKVNSEISIIIKQSSTELFNIKWSANILWEGKQQHIMSQSKNSMDLIKLYQLPESQHFLGKIIAQNFSY